jgi:protein-arginine kinase activator protein McsA
VDKGLREEINIVQDLRARLQKAVEAEEFEEAAQLRDQIKAAQEKQQKDADK